MARDDRLKEARNTLLEARKLLQESKRSKEQGSNRHSLATSQTRGAQAQHRQSRAIIGGQLPLSDNAAGVDSFPGPDVTFTPPLQVQNPMVNLGCLSSAQITDIVPVNVTWPSTQVPSSFDTGAAGPLFANQFSDNPLAVGPLGTGAEDNVPSGQGQPNPTDATGSVQGGGAFSQYDIGNQLVSGSPTPFQSAVYLTSDVQLYNIAATAAGYGNIVLSQEGVLWTLWPLTKASPGDVGAATGTYFDDFVFGTAKSSRYPIGQMGFFTNNILQGCTPFGAVNTNSGWNPGAQINGVGQPGLNPYSPGILPGVEGLNQALLITTEQEVAIVVVKVAEEIARIFNPAAGIAASERYIYVGYDAWAVFVTTANPMGPMAAQTYITPQTVSGSVVGNNYQVVVPPNFPTTVYYKNQRRVVPVDTDVGLFAGTAFTASGTGIGPVGSH